MIRTLTLLLLGAEVCSADLTVTEVMAKSTHANTQINGDWWELTNTGDLEVDLSGYTWDDTPTPLEPSISTFPNISIQPGESIVILQEDVASVPAWKSAWGLSAANRVFSREQFNPGGGGESFSSFSSDGDEVNVYDDSGMLIAHVEFGATVDGDSKGFLRDGTAIYGLNSSEGKHAAINSNQIIADTASPADAGIHFTTAPTIYGMGSYSSPLTAENEGNPAPSFSATQIPDFLDLTAGAAGSASLESKRPLTLADAGNYLVRITATSGGTSTIQEFLLTILNPEPTVILNEYNAVADDEFLNGGALSVDSDGGDPSEDSHFGRILGNGGDWMEWVVVGAGTAGRIDLRGWKIEIGKNEGTGFTATNTLVLADHPDWEAVPTGSILTFIDKNSAQGGLDSGIGLRDERTTDGDTWSNIWIGDPDRLDYSSLAVNGYTILSGVVSGIDIDNSGTQFRISNAAGEIVFGPVGEGVAPLSGTTSEEVFELENNPSPAISPIVATSETEQGYDDGATDSTFGQRNNWTVQDATMTQSFAAYIASGFLLWTEAAGLTGDDALSTADPDLDLRDNLSEYAFGGNPAVRDAGYPAGPVQLGDELGWSYVRRSSDPGLVFTYETSEALSGWSPVTPLSFSGVPFAADPDFETLTLSFALPSPMPPKWFIRTVAE